MSLYQFGDPAYKHIRQCGVPHKTPGYPLDLNYGGVYTPNVTFFRNNQSKYFTLKEQPFRCDVISVAALFRRVMDEPEFAGKFRLLVFAILERPRKPHGPDGNFAPFYQEFGTCDLP